MPSYREDLIVSLKVLESIRNVSSISFTKAISISQMYSMASSNKPPQEWSEQQQRWDTIGNKSKEIHQMILDCILLEVEENIKESQD